MIKKLLVLTLALCMVLSLIPITPVHAESDSSTTSSCAQGREPTSVEITDGGRRSRTELQLQVGESFRLYGTIYPLGVGSGITWESSDPSIVHVDNWGLVTALKQGEATVTATTYNGKTATCRIYAPQDLPQLQYQLTADGAGYEIVGYDSNAYAAHIPATYNGLPVVSIKGGAFKDCANLRFFTVDAEQQTFYAEGGVIFTNDPEKTLVCFPPAYDAASYYIVPEGTVKIAPFAFAGYCSSDMYTLTIPEGVREIGDRAFYEVRWQIPVYVPDSLTEIGEHLMEKQTANVAFYGSKGCAFQKYANANQIPFGLVADIQGLPTTVETVVPENDDLSTIPVLDGESYVLYEDINPLYRDVFDYEACLVHTFNLSTYESENSCEVRLLLEPLYWDIAPDVNGQNAIGAPGQTGLYGMGYTESEAILRAYDRDGTLIAAKRINGNFAFSFPGAYNLGVEGGTNTTFTVLPVEPIFITSAGSYQINPEEWYKRKDGNILQYFVVCLPGACWTPYHPDFLNNCSMTAPTVSNKYAVVVAHTNSAALVDDMSMCSLIFDGMDCLLDNGEFACWVAGSFGQTKEFADKAYDVLSAVKNVMVGTYYPASEPIQKITIWGDGSYSTVFGDTIYLSESDVTDLNTLVLAHEMVHAVDNSIPASDLVSPSAWLEGRAEHISRVVCEALGVDYYGYSSHYDWSFLSAEEKADFFYYYYFSANRYTVYDVGYRFLCYLNETYGEDVSAKIMENIAALTDYDHSQEHGEVNAALFKKCVEDATEVGVFQRFVCEVVEGGRHTEVIDSAVEATCVAPGWTEGSSCSVCNKVFVAQQMIPALPHTPGQPVAENIVAPTCTAHGSYDNVIYCTGCETELSRETVMDKEPLGHTEVIDAAVAPTCAATGRTEGTHCSVCNKVVVAQQIITTLPHTPGQTVVENILAPTCTAHGSYDNVTYCTVCKGEASRETIFDKEPLGHKEAVVNAVEPTCSSSGRTEGVVCVVCHEFLVEQKPIQARHSFGGWIVDRAPTTEVAGRETRTCVECGKIESRAIEKLPAANDPAATDPAVDDSNKAEPAEKDIPVGLIVAVAVIVAGIAVSVVLILKKKR